MVVQVITTTIYYPLYGYFLLDYPSGEAYCYPYHSAVTFMRESLMSEREVFGLRLRSRRRQLGLSQEVLAAKLGIRTASISRYEQGVYHEMTFARLRDIARALQTSTDFLLGLSNDAGPIPDRRCPADGHSPESMTHLPATILPEGVTADA